MKSYIILSISDLLGIVGYFPIKEQLLAVESLINLKLLEQINGIK